MKKRILFVFGTRPEAIKMAPVILLARKQCHFDVKVCVTGQHRQMLDQVLSLFKIDVDYDLNLMKAGQSLNEIITAVITGLTGIFNDEKFDCVLVHGDTTTTMAASLAAFNSKVNIAHIEAGLRTYNMLSPWPEELNRRVTGLTTKWHFAPTQISKDNLLSEHVDEKTIFITGNTVIDALLQVKNKIETDTEMLKSLQNRFSFIDPNSRMILVTGHRRENFGKSFEEICTGLRELSAEKNVQIVYPVHMNPNIQEPARRILEGLPNVYLLEPQDYVNFVYLMMQSYIIVTDSGGVQEEAPSLEKPVLVMRDTTERPEALHAGTVRLVGAIGSSIVQNCLELLNNEKEYLKMKMALNPYGDGLASYKILEILNHEV